MLSGRTGRHAIILFPKPDASAGDLSVTDADDTGVRLQGYRRERRRCGGDAVPKGTALVTVGRYLEAIQAFSKSSGGPATGSPVPGWARSSCRSPGFLFARPQSCRTGRCRGPTLAGCLVPPWTFPLIARGNYTGAADCLGPAVALLQDHSEAWFFFGNCCCLRGEAKSSVELF